MPVELNHTIVAARDPESSARFLTGVLGLADPGHYGPFVTVETANGVSLDFLATDGPIVGQHYAFLISEDEFDEIHSRIRRQDIPYWADPYKTLPSQINDGDGGRAIYFESPDGHLLEIITQPYGSSG